MTSGKPKKRGRPRENPTKVLPIRVPVQLFEHVERFADLLGVSRNQAGVVLLRSGLTGQCPLPVLPSGGYNPLTGEYDA